MANSAACRVGFSPWLGGALVSRWLYRYGMPVALLLAVLGMLMASLRADGFWYTAEQRGYRAYLHGDYADAAENFQSPARRPALVIGWLITPVPLKPLLSVRMRSLTIISAIP